MKNCRNPTPAILPVQADSYEWFVLKIFELGLGIEMKKLGKVDNREKLILPENYPTPEPIAPQQTVPVAPQAPVPVVPQPGHPGGIYTQMLAFQLQMTGTQTV